MRKPPRSVLYLLCAALFTTACIVAEQPNIGNYNSFADGETPAKTFDAGGGGSCEGGASSSGGEAGACAVSFLNSVVPILNSNCFGCHAGTSNPQIVFPPQPTGQGFYDALLAAKIVGQTGIYLNQCEPAKSAVACNLGVANCTPSGVTMPPNTPLQEADKQVIAAWLACGAPNN